MLRFLVFFSLSIFTGIGMSDQKMIKKEIDFGRISWFADRAAAAYQDEDKIRAAYPNTQVVVELKEIDVQYFVEFNVSENQQIVAIRGTANKSNIFEDAEYLQTKNKALGIYLHDGFNKDSLTVYESLLNHLDKDKQIVLTGHSLGAAISTILMMYLENDGYDVAPSINFGQPKVTNIKGVEKFSVLPLMRIVDKNDVVPLVPANTLLDSIHGQYQHLGEEVILLEEESYVYLPQKQASELSLGSFWKDIKHLSVKQHFMAHYIKNIVDKKNQSFQVPYSKRESYID